MMKLWLISQRALKDYDTYSDAVVAAPTRWLAQRTHPGGSRVHDAKRKIWLQRAKSGKLSEDCSGSWPDDLGAISVQLLGEATRGVELGVICASFHAG